MKVRSRGTSKQYWVCTNCIPASIFFSRRSTRKSKGGTKGLAAPPTRTRGGLLMARPLSKRDSSRILRTSEMSDTASRSNTGFAAG